MTFNGIRNLYDDGGDYIVLVDYGTEGTAIQAQFNTLKEAQEYILCGINFPCAIVKLVRAEFVETTIKEN